MPIKKQSGFTLIEALVALVVLAVGLLGLATMQIKALQGAHVAYQRTLATMAAQDMVERLWIEVGKNVSSAGVSCPAPNTIFVDWYDVWSAYLPSLEDPVVNSPIPNPEASPSSCRYVITIRWEDERFFQDETSELVYVARVFGDSSP